MRRGERGGDIPEPVGELRGRKYRKSTSWRVWRACESAFFMNPHSNETNSKVKAYTCRKKKEEVRKKGK